MLEREDRLNIQGLAEYLQNIVKAFTEQPDKVNVTFDELPRQIIFHLSVSDIDLPALELHQQTTYRSLNHIIRKATIANIDISGILDDQFGVTP